MNRAPSHSPRRSSWLLPLAAAAGLLGACSSAPAWPPEPAELALGEEACAHCRMLVSEARFAAQAHNRDGTVEFFDDLGCLLDRHRASPLEPAGVFVLVEEGRTWIRADRAHVVHSRALNTPMGHGLLAFATREAAEAEASRHADASVAPLDRLLRDGASFPGRQARDPGASATP